MPFIVVDSIVGTWSYKGRIFTNGAVECDDSETIDAATADANEYDWLSVEWDVPEAAIDPVVEQDSGAVTKAELEGETNVCPECEKELATKGGLKNHIRIVHGDEALEKAEAPEPEPDPDEEDLLEDEEDFEEPDDQVPAEEDVEEDPDDEDTEAEGETAEED